MYLFEQVGRILYDMTKNKLRVFLTMLGIIVGVCSVVLIVSIGNSVTTALKVFLAGSLGDNRVTVYISSQNGKNYNMKYDEVYEFGKKIPDVTGPLLESNNVLEGQARVDDDHYSSASVRGVSYSYFDAYAVVLAAGRVLNNNDCQYHSSAAVISDIAAVNCFGSVEDALNSQLSVIGSNGKIVDLTVVGVYKDISSVTKYKKVPDKRMWMTEIFCPFEFLEEQYEISLSSNEFSELTYVTKNDADMEGILAAIQTALKQRYDDEDYHCSCYRAFARAEETGSLLTMLIAVFASAAGLSLVVGGISLMNTMLVTVKERTKEIGTRKAIGASNGSIVFQFLLESVVICLVACVIGVIICGIIITILQQNMDLVFELIDNEELKNYMQLNDVSISMSGISILVSVLFSVVVGMLFGVDPALKAAKMQVTDALRYE